MRLQRIGFPLALIIALGLLAWGGVGALREHREIQKVSGPIDQAWVQEWLCIRRDECGTSPPASLDAARLTIEGERATRRTEHLAPRRNFVLLAVLGPIVTLLIFFLLRRMLGRGAQS